MNRTKHALPSNEEILIRVKERLHSKSNNSRRRERTTLIKDTKDTNSCRRRAFGPSVPSKQESTKTSKVARRGACSTGHLFDESYYAPPTSAEEQEEANEKDVKTPTPSPKLSRRGACAAGNTSFELPCSTLPVVEENTTSPPKVKRSPIRNARVRSHH